MGSAHCLTILHISTQNAEEDIMIFFKYLDD